jgi:hypothetical protein
MMPAIKLITMITGSVLLLSGCETTSGPPAEITMAAEETFDGLRLVNNTQAQKVWIRPGTDLSRYTRIWPQSAGIQFRPVEGRARQRSQGEFQVSDRARDRLRAVMSEAFDAEFARLERYEIADGPGPDVMKVRGALLDVVSFVPPEATGRSDVFISTVGAMTFVVELRDSESNAVIVRTADRRAAQRAGGTIQQSNRVTNQAEVRRLAQRWARWLREGLDGLPAYTPADD